MRETYNVPTGFHFTNVSTIKAAKQLARQYADCNGECWFARVDANQKETQRYRFNGYRWKNS